MIVMVWFQDFGCIPFAPRESKRASPGCRCRNSQRLLSLRQSSPWDKCVVPSRLHWGQQHERGHVLYPKRFPNRASGLGVLAAGWMGVTQLMNVVPFSDLVAFALVRPDCVNCIANHPWLRFNAIGMHREPWGFKSCPHRYKLLMHVTRVTFAIVVVGILQILVCCPRRRLGLDDSAVQRNISGYKMHISNIFELAMGIPSSMEHHAEIHGY